MNHFLLKKQGKVIVFEKIKKKKEEEKQAKIQHSSQNYASSGPVWAHNLYRNEKQTDS